MRYDADDYEPDTGPPWTCPDCNSDDAACPTCGGTGEVCEGEEEDDDDR